jgi:hypothetical protein
MSLGGRESLQAEDALLNLDGEILGFGSLISQHRSLRSAAGQGFRKTLMSESEKQLCGRVLAK